jgi:hypothetical protein
MSNPTIAFLSTNLAFAVHKLRYEYVPGAAVRFSALDAVRRGLHPYDAEVVRALDAELDAMKSRMESAEIQTDEGRAAVIKAANTMISRLEVLDPA